MFKRIAISLTLVASFAQPALAQSFALDTARIEQVTGMKGTYNPVENVYKISKPRPEMNVRVDGWKISPFMGTGSWAAFTSGGAKQAMVMGDNVLFEDEVGPTMSAALENGFRTPIGNWN